MNKLQSTIIALIIGLAVAITVLAWTNPTGNPPTGGGALYYSGGNVGIGTTGPSHKLTVSGDVRVAGGGAILAEGSVYLATSAGNVGIGTTGPGAKLDINGNTFARSTVVMKSGSQLQFNNAADAAVGFIQGVTPGANGQIQFQNTGGTAQMVIEPGNGNVGIGTTAPGYKLDVAGEIRATGAIRTNTGSAIYNISNAYCANPNLLTTSATCQTRVCYGDEYNTYYFTCAGSCWTVTTPQTCSNTFIGRLLSSY